MPIILAIIIGLIVTVVVLYLINAYISDIRLKQILSILIILALIVWLLNFFFKFL